MRRIFLFVVLLTVSLMLIACNSDKADLDSAFGGTQKIEVFTKEGENLTSISDENEIADFVKMLQLDNWKVEKIPTDSTVDKEFIMYQTDTVKFGESSSDKKELKEVGNFTMYKDIPYIDFQVKNTTFSFKIPEEVATYLSNYK